MFIEYYIVKKYSALFMNNYIVYKHTSPSNKVYIGITRQKNPNNRWRKGRGYNIYFKRAVEKYGWENFTHEILFSNLSEEQAKQLEIELIEKYQSTNQEYGYNITLGGEGGNGYKHTQETKQRISNTEKGRTSPMKGRHHSEQTRKKLSESNKGKICWTKGIHLSEEHKKKIGDTQRGKPKFQPHTPESFLRRSLARKGKITSEATKQKMSESHKFFRENKKPILFAQVNTEGDIVHVFYTRKQMSDFTGIPQTTLGKYIQSGKLLKNNYYKKIKREDVKNL